MNIKQYSKVQFNFLVPYSVKTRNLGIIFGQHLSWDPPVSELIKKMFSTVSFLRKLLYFLPLPTKNMVAQSLLQPILHYADTCYLDLKLEQLNKRERLQNVCNSYLVFINDHVSEFHINLKRLPIRFLILYSVQSISCTVFKRTFSIPRIFA